MCEENHLPPLCLKGLAKGKPYVLFCVHFCITELRFRFLEDISAELEICIYTSSNLLSLGIEEFWLNYEEE